MRIAGEELADLDFTAMFTQLAYREVGRSLPEGDPYDDVEGLELSGITDPERYERTRSALKKGLNAFLFISGKMQRLPRDVKDALGPSWNATRLAEVLRQRHAPIKHLFGTGIGLRLMFTESTILVRTLLDLIDLGVPALPIHDGVMVPASKQELAARTMGQASRTVLGVELPIKVKTSPVLTK